MTTPSNTLIDLHSVSNFNDKVMPIRKPHHGYDIYRFVENPFCRYRGDTIYSVILNNEYVAQMLTMPAPLVFKGEEIPAFWGQDYFVLKEYRGKGIGKDLANRYLAQDYYIAVGFSEKSEIIHRKMGAKPITYLDDFEKWQSFSKRIKFYIHRILKVKNKNISEYIFPKNIKIGNLNFKRIEDTSEINLPNKQWNDNCVETLRDERYFKWRFLYKPNRYFIYILENSNPNLNSPYIVLKPYFYKGVNWLKVVDYRFSLTSDTDFENLMDLANHFVKSMKLYGTIVSSSMKSTNHILQKLGFRKTRHEVVLTTYPFTHKEQEKSEEMNNYVFMSFADSDLDMHNNKGKFNFE